VSLALQDRVAIAAAELHLQVDGDATDLHQLTGFNRAFVSAKCRTGRRMRSFCILSVSQRCTLHP
jgi:hypothetical protein